MKHHLPFKSRKELKTGLHRLFISFFLVNIVFASPCFPQTQKPRSVKDMILTVNLSNASLEESFKIIEEKTLLSFSYNQNDINKNIRISQKFTKTRMSDVLAQLSKQAGLTFYQINDNIHVKPKREGLPNADGRKSLRAARVITGKVRSVGDNLELPGVSVLIKGTTTGTVTDTDGNYTIEVENENAILVYSYVGYITEEVRVGARTQIDVVLSPDVTSLEGVVVIGYGARDKKDITSSIQQIGADEINRAVGLTPEAAMQGTMTGVFVSSAGGSPNEAPTVRIRGVGTFYENDPLYVIDGIPVVNDGTRPEVNPLNMINMNNIESITVLKDAAAASIYGVRAANGVVLINTKKGSIGKPKLTLDTRFGFTNLPQLFETLDVRQYTALYQESHANGGEPLPGVFDPDSPEYLGDLPTVNWQEELRNRNALAQDYNISVSGGNESSTYSLTGGFSDYESPIEFEFNRRGNIGANLDFKIQDWIEVGTNLKYSYSRANSNTSADTEVIGGLTSYSEVPPWQQLYDESHVTGLASWRGWGNGFNPNIIGLQRYQEMLWNVQRGLGTGYVKITPFPGNKYLKGLDIKGTASIDHIVYLRTWRQEEPWLSRFVDHVAENGNTFSELNTRSTNLVQELAVHYNYNFGKHGIDLLFNIMKQEFETRNSNIRDQEVSVLDREKGVIQGPIDRVTAAAGRDEWGLLGYLGRFSYNYAGRYYIDATFRRDGSSRFAPRNRWGNFYSVSGAWRISGEAFMDNINWLNDLKLRAGWGQLGNQDTGLDNFSYLSKVNRNPQYTLGSGRGEAGVGAGLGIQGAGLDDFSNADLTWETAETTSIAVDFGVLQNRLTGTLEWYNRTTKDIIQQTELPDVAGNIFNPNFNVASVENRGVEIALRWQDDIGDFSYFLGGNLTTQTNEVTQLAGGVPLNLDGNLRIEEGKSMFFIFGYQTDGIFQTQEEVDAWLAENSDPGADNFKGPGDVVYVDVGGTDPETGNRTNQPDGFITDFGDRTELGKTIPGFFYGFNMGASWKNIDVSLFFQGIGDVDKINWSYFNGTNMSGDNANLLTDVLDRWTPTNPSNEIPRAYRNDQPRNNRLSDRHVESGAFMRLKNVQIGYNLPQSLLEKYDGITEARVYVAGNNMFTLTDWRGLDPESDYQPLGRQLVVGVRLGF